MTDNERKGTIVGIDPGSTSAVAVLNLRGKLKDLVSRKHMGKVGMIRTISEKGKPILIATDKRKMPSTIEDISTDFSAETFLPEEDIPIDKKKELTEEYNYDNLHERDALAAAVNAYNSLENKFENIESRMDELNLQDMTPKIKELVVKGNAGNVSEAIEMVVGEENQDYIEKSPRKQRKSAEELEERIDNYRKIILKERKDRQKISEHNEKLKERVDDLKGKVSDLKDKRDRLERGMKKDIMESREIKKLERNLRSKEKRIEVLENEKAVLKKKAKKIKRFEKLRKDKKVPLRRIDPLTETELRKEDMDLSLYNSIIITSGPIKSPENVIEVLKDVGARAVIGDFKEDTVDSFIDKGIMVSNKSEIEVDEEHGVEYIEASNIVDMEKAKRDSFIAWLKRYRDGDD